MAAADRGRDTTDFVVALQRLVDLYSPLYLNDTTNADPLLRRLIEVAPDSAGARLELDAMLEGRGKWGYGATFARGGDSPSPILFKYVPPLYPEAARKAGVKGVVILKVRINEMGHVEAARVVRSIPTLDAAALAAVRQWQFMRTMVRGAAAVVIADVPVTFTTP